MTIAARLSAVLFVFAAGAAIAGAAWDRGERNNSGGAVAPGESNNSAAPDFELRVLPTLTKIGCNSGQCHGAAGGQAGFALSLRGYDPDADYDAIVRERGGRRVDLTDALQSLVLRKPSMRVPHKGGRKLPEGGAAYGEIAAWIEAGAPRHSEIVAKGGDGARPAAVAGIVVSPAEKIGKPGDKFALVIEAKLSDGGKRDVTDLSLLSSNDESIARVDNGGNVEIVGAGETAILVRFASRVGYARVGAPFAAPYVPKPRAKVSIDSLVEKKLGAMGIVASPPCDDAAFLRRATLDLAGRIPGPEEVRDFTSGGSSANANDRRAALVDQLLASEQAAARWARWLADLCRLRSESMGPGGAMVLHQFLRSEIDARRPLDATIRALVTATGDPSAQGPAAFNLASPGPMEQMEFVTKTFLGARMQCAQCHQHPYDRWSRQDYFGAAAFFARMRREGGKVFVASSGEFNDPKTGRAAMPRFPAGDLAKIPEGADRRAVFCDWLLDKDSLRFDRAIANRLWKELFGRGLVEPVDDLRESNPAVNSELLDFLAAEFRDGGRDLLRFAAKLATTEAYARAATPMPGAERDERYASHAIVRPLAAPVLLDSLLRASGLGAEIPNFKSVKTAMEIPDDDGGLYSLLALGRCPRDGSADPSSPPSPTVPMALHFIHGPIADEWLSAKGRRVERILYNWKNAEGAVDELFLASLGRYPGAGERVAALEAIGDKPNREALEDFLWSLMCTAEFATNH